jgi:autotransporter-associated beta strand protein
MSFAPNRKLMRPAGLLLAAGAALSLSRAAIAQYAWVPTVASSGTWSTAANWTPGAPVSGIDTTLSFSNPFYSAGFSSSDNIAGNFDLNAIILASECVNPTVGNSLLSVGSAAGSTVTFNTNSLGGGPSISIDGAGNATLSVSTLLAANLAVNATSTGQLTFSGTIANAGSGTRDVTVNVGNALFTWNPSSTAGWTGNLNLNGGTLALGGTGALGSNALVVNGGALRLGVSGAIANNVTLNSDLRISAFSSNTGLLTGTLSGGGGLVVAPQSGTNNTLQLEGISGFTGALTVNGGNTSLGGVSLRNTNGSLTGTTSYNIHSGSTLTLDNNTSGFNSNRVRDDATISLHRANLTLTANATAANTVNESIGSLAFSGMSNVVVNTSTTAGVGAATTLTIGSLSRVDNGTLSMSGTSIGSGPAALGVSNVSVTSSIAGSLIGGGASSGTTQSVLPYAVGRNLVTASSMDAHVVVGPDGLRPLTMNEYNQSLYLLRGTTSQENVAARNDLVAGAFGGAWLDRPTTVNALLVNAVSGGANVGTSVYGPTTLTVGSGSIVMGISGGTGANLGPSTIGVGTLAFGSAEGIIHANAGSATNSTAGAAINSTITGSGGLTKSGLGVLALNGANTFTGQVTLNAGTLNVSSDANLGDASNALRLNGGSTSAVVNSTNVTFPSLMVFLPSNVFGDGTAQTMSTSRSMSVGAAGGGVGVASPNAELTVSSGISGNGTLTIGSQTAVGLVNLTGVNTHTGGTVVNGQLAINSASALGSGDLNLEAGSVFRPTAGTTALAIPNNIRVDGSTSVYTPSGSTVTLNGSMLLSSGTNFSLTKVGAGVLEITAPGAMAGGVSLGSGAPTVVGSQSLFELPGQTVLRGNGTLAGATLFNLNPGSELVLDNTSTNVNNRMSASVVSPGGGALTLKGNASVPTVEGIGALTLVGSNGQEVITVKPNAAQNAMLVMPSFSFNSSGPSWLLVRGDSLGAAPGAGVANVFIGSTPTGALGSGSAPTLTNNVITGFVASSSSTTDATSFATYSTTQGVQPLAAYASGASLANFTATNNVDLATPQTLAAASSANALRLRGAANFNTGGNTLTIGTGMLLSTLTGGGSISGGGTLSLTGTGMIYNTTDLNLGSTTIAGGTNFTKGGQGTLTLANANAGLTGTMNIGGGSLKFSAAGSLPATASVFIQPSILGDTKLDLNGFNVSLGRVSGLGTVDLGSGGSLAVTNSFSSFVNIIGSGRTVGGPALRLGSGGTLTGLSSFTGQTVLGGGTTTVLTNTPAGGSGNGPFGSSSEAIQLGDAVTTATTTLSLASSVDSFNRDLVLPSQSAGGAPSAQITAIQSQGSTGTVNIGSNISTGRSLRLAGTSGSFTGGQATISGVISNNGSDAGSVEFSTGNWNLTGNNTYSGGTTLANTTGAMLGLGNDNALGTGNVSISAGAGTLRATGGARTIANNIVFTAAATNGLGIAGVNDINFTGTVGLGSTAQRFNIFNTGKTTFSGVISGGPASGTAFTKAGGGTLVFSNVNTITGDTRLAAGVMLANNASGSAFGSGVVTVDPAAILGGNGFIAGNVVLSAGGVIAPGSDVGASIGTLTLGGLSTVSGSIFTFDLQDQYNPSTNDLIALSGALGSISGIVDVCPKPGFVAGIFPLFTYSGSQLTSGSLTLTPGFLAAYPSAFIDYTTQANTVLLNVPSPGAMAVLSISGVLAARRRRR